MEKPKVAVVTGGAQGIGKAICDAFSEKGVSVCPIDLKDNGYFVGDMAMQCGDWACLMCAQCD